MMKKTILSIAVCTVVIGSLHAQQQPVEENFQWKPEYCPPCGDPCEAQETTKELIRREGNGSPLEVEQGSTFDVPCITPFPPYDTGVEIYQNVRMSYPMIEYWKWDKTCHHIEEDCPCPSVDETIDCRQDATLDWLIWEAKLIENCHVNDDIEV